MWKPVLQACCPARWMPSGYTTFAGIGARAYGEPVLGGCERRGFDTPSKLGEGITGGPKDIGMKPLGRSSMERIVGGAWLVFCEKPVFDGAPYGITTTGSGSNGLFACSGERRSSCVAFSLIECVSLCVDCNVCE